MQSFISYAAVGRMVGTYHANSSDLSYGVLITNDNLEFPAISNGAALKKIRADIEANQTPTLQTWRVYPRTRPVLQFALIRNIQFQPINASVIDQFNIVGELAQTSKRSTIIRVYRSSRGLNLLAEDSATISFTLKLNGAIPDAHLGEIWAIDAARNGNHLDIRSAKYVAPSRDSNLHVQPPLENGQILQPVVNHSRFFRVQVAGRTFVGKRSVQLEGGMLHIDDQPIVSTNFAVVTGPIRSIHADRITPMQNEFILQSQ